MILLFLIMDESRTETIDDKTIQVINILDGFIRLFIEYLIIVTNDIV